MGIVASTFARAVPDVIFTWWKACESIKVYSNTSFFEDIVTEGIQAVLSSVSLAEL
jgi:hypothetical protein